jgi:hypothetical protein
MTIKVEIVITLIKSMIKKGKEGEIWIGLVGISSPMHAEQIEEKPDGSIEFIRLVEWKDGYKRKELVKTRKENIAYVSETLELESGV